MMKKVDLLKHLRHLEKEALDSFNQAVERKDHQLILSSMDRLDSIDSHIMAEEHCRRNDKLARECYINAQSCQNIAVESKRQVYIQQLEYFAGKSLQEILAKQRNKKN